MEPMLNIMNKIQRKQLRIALKSHHLEGFRIAIWKIIFKAYNGQ
jgi:hypothetical protein